jgi:hypothetical protein
MSEVESKKGTLKSFPRFEGETDKDYVLRFIDDAGREIPDYYEKPEENLEELFSDLFYREAVFCNGFIYPVHNVVDGSEADIFEAVRTDDGDIRFFVQFYNGGCSFDEAIGYALENMERGGDA